MLVDTWIASPEHDYELHHDDLFQRRSPSPRTVPRAFPVDREREREREPMRERERDGRDSRPPPGGGSHGGFSPSGGAPAPARPRHAPQVSEPTNVLGVFGLSIRTRERDLEDEFQRHGNVEKVVIVYDQRVRLPALRIVVGTQLIYRLTDREDSDSSP
jgi:hypothetical protein